MNKKNCSPKHISDKRDTGMTCQFFFLFFFLLFNLSDYFTFRILFLNKIGSARKRPATSPAPIAHNQQQTSHHTNVNKN